MELMTDREFLDGLRGEIDRGVQVSAGTRWQLANMWIPLGDANAHAFADWYFDASKWENYDDCYVHGFRQQARELAQKLGEV